MMKAQTDEFGFRERDVFYILWFDRDFSVYRHE